MDQHRKQGSAPKPDLEKLQQQLESLERENSRLRDLAEAAVAQCHPDSLMTPPSIDGWYHMLTQNINDVIWLRDMNLRLTYISPSALRISGYTQKESMQLPFEQWLTPASLEHAMIRLQEAIERAEGVSEPPTEAPIETEMLCKDGSTCWIESQVTLLRNPRGKPVGLLGVTRDITERHRIREELKERNRLLESIFNNLRQVFFVLNISQMRMEEISPSCEEIFGVSSEALHADPMSWLTPILAEDRERVQKGFDKLRSGARTDSLAEYRIRRPDGAVRWMQSRIRRRNEGREIFFDGFISDITERKRLEGQLQQSQKMEAIGTLAGGIAHDMNNVLGVVMGLGSVLQAQVTAESPLRKHVDGILSVSRRGRDLTRNLLGFARKGKFRREAVVLNHVVEEVISLLGRTLPKSIVIRTRLDGALDPVEGDPSQLNHALMNLCLNACDAMQDEGTLTITTQNIKASQIDGAPRELAAQRYARLEISDTGEGMSPETVKRAFEPFFSTKPRGRGTGLGLSMVYGTITNHGGEVSLDSEVGRGTRVTLQLPTIARVDVAMPAPQPGPPETANAKGTILVVDDEELVRFAVEQMLTTLGYHVIAVDSGGAALEVVQELHEKIGLVLLDLQMPHMDGEETFHKLRAIDAHIPVLLCSGFSVETKAEQLLAAGACGYLPKPFEMDALSVQIAAGLRLHKQHMAPKP
jgi:PAS domain S-box-containing protein